MYLYIPERVLQSDLTATQKILLSYLLLLLKQDRHYYGSPEYLSGTLGLAASELKAAMDNLISRELVEIVYDGATIVGLKARR